MWKYGRPPRTSCTAWADKCSLGPCEYGVPGDWLTPTPSARGRSFRGMGDGYAVEQREQAIGELGAVPALHLRARDVGSEIPCERLLRPFKRTSAPGFIRETIRGGRAAAHDAPPRPASPRTSCSMRAIRSIRPYPIPGRVSLGF